MEQRTAAVAGDVADVPGFETGLREFCEFGRRTRVVAFPDPEVRLPVYVNEFWTSKQRAAHSLHEISYRACFKPQLPRFFITRLTRPGELVHDPFMGRGTTPLEAALLGRRAVGSDLNPLSARLLEPRFDPPEIAQVAERLASFDLERAAEAPEDLLAFYHPATLRRVVNLRDELRRRRNGGLMDGVDRWIQMVATNRLTGHSPGFFSVYTLPPNQAASVRSQRRINERRRPGAARPGRRGPHPPEDPFAAGPPGTRRPGAVRARRPPVAHRVRRPDSGDRRRDRPARRDLAALSRRGELPGRQLAAVLVQRGGWG